MPARPCLAAIFLLAAPALAATPTTLPTNDPPTYKLKTSAEWMYVALDRDEGTRAEGIRALINLAAVQPDLAPVLADLLARDPSDDIRARIAAELPTLVKAQPAAWAGQLDAVLDAASDTDLEIVRTAAVKAATSLAAADAATPDQRARTVKTLAGLLDLGPAPANMSDTVYDAISTTAAEGLASLAPRDPAAAKALHVGLKSSRTPVRLASISGLLKVDPSYKPADAAAAMVAQVDALTPQSGADATAIGGWIESNARDGGAVAAMAPADRQAVAEAIGGVFRRLIPPQPSAGGQGLFQQSGSPVFDGLIGGLADLGPDALPALSAVREVDERFSGNRDAKTIVALHRLYALQSAPATKPAAGE